MFMLKRILPCLIISVFILVGCQTTIPITVDRDKLMKPTSPPNIKLTMLSQAKDARSGYATSQVGRHTLSILMIPTFRTTSDNESLESGIANRTKEILTSLGYTVSTVDKLNESKYPVLVIQIDYLRNLLFSWLYPLGLTWGHMQLSLHLMTPSGEELWKANLEGGSGIMPSLFYMCGFESRVRDDLTENENQLIKEISSNEFTAQLKKAQSVN
jgi:hypothetical protein